MSTIIYTCITQGYDELQEIKTSHRAICFTDMDIQSKTWEIIRITDTYKLNRKIKICPHLFLPTHSRNVWIDGNAELENIDELISEKKGFWCMDHPDRKCAYVEGIYCIEKGKDTEETIMAQLNKYYANGFPVDNGLVSCGLLIRDDCKKNRKFGEAWWNEVNEHSIRDQISFPYAAWTLNFSYNTIPFQRDRYIKKHWAATIEVADVLKTKKFDVKQSIIISSETIAGSDWLMDLLTVMPQIIVNWEPSHPKLGVLPARLKWGFATCAPEDINADIATIIKEVLTLKKYSDWTIRYCGPKEVHKGSIVLTKFQNTSAILPWLTKQFEFQYRPIYIVQHPLVTVMADTEPLTLNFDNLYPASDPDTLVVNIAYINNLETDIEKKIALWCLYNAAVINHPDNGQNWLLIYYEDLLTDPKSEFKRILNEFQLNISEKALNRIIERRRYRSNVVFPLQEDPLTPFEKQYSTLSPYHLSKIQAVLDHFNLRSYSAFNKLPVR